MIPTAKYHIRENLLKFVYPRQDYIDRHPTEYNEIKQYLTNLLNLCISIGEMYEILPKPIHSALPRITYKIDESEIKFRDDFMSFQQKSVDVNKKLNKLLTIKLLTT